MCIFDFVPHTKVRFVMAEDNSKKTPEVMEFGDNTAPSEVESTATFAPNTSKVPPQPEFVEG